ncbi:craniofacial development protein 2 [Elysia marginata]|uniref:Craniofacial development protein 2 n=1 Tax=Elysia marginata TaxID=1093978 RepID=A0AAV4FX64_9GAST|nr:craniofacial development protein 2 [Elysia marginata]
MRVPYPHGQLVSGDTLLYSGHTERDAHYTEGVAFMLTPIAQKALIGWKLISSRIISAKLTTKRKNINLHIVQCYAPTNDAEEEIKDGFYQQLQAELDNKKTNDITILMGDFNARIGADNKCYEEIMGTHGIGQINVNGERFADLCALNQMVIGGSIFPHKNIHKVTWRSPDHTTENQIDHICFVKRFRKSFQDVRVMRGADVSSDHHMIMTTLKLKLKKYPATNAVRKRYNVQTLQNKDVQGKFQKMD